MHHADLAFDVTTGFRFHPIEILLSMLIKLAAIAALGAPALAVRLLPLTETRPGLASPLLRAPEPAADLLDIAGALGTAPALELEVPAAAVMVLSFPRFVICGLRPLRGM